MEVSKKHEGETPGQVNREGIQFNPGYGNRLRAEKFKDRIFSDMGAKM
ncbi:hypothetical protein GCM10011396_02180 [Undibacterium terreum]|uniref:Uncharacterized protein n=1 Tax=Undibacterium terreum TaxID=1224302 RepID=A0A916U3M2_9BURK|nr:hypothetical protein GCM10011396_02180 [Undibacterium terreum]